MTLVYTVELSESTKLTTHCPDFHELNRKIQSAVFHAIMTNTTAPEMPKVTRVSETLICSRCAAPLLPSGACSSHNCPVGRQPFRKLSAAQLARQIPGIKIASKLKK